MAVCLYRIGMKQDTVLLCNGSDLLNRLNGSDLIVCKHDRNKNGIRADGLFQLIQLYYAIFIHIQISDLIPSFSRYSQV